MRPWVVIYRLNEYHSWFVWRRFWRYNTAQLEAMAEFSGFEARVVHRKYVKSYTG